MPYEELPATAIGSTFADHLIRGVAGRGGMGVVYRATHLSLKRDVALKVIAPELSADGEFRARFRREFVAAASIEHPNVISIYHAGEEDGLLYVTMRYVEGIDLARLLAAEGRIAPARAAGLIAQVADGLDAAHHRGVVHRDVKPSNVLIVGDGDGARALLTDFGLTKMLSDETRLTRKGVLVGTFDYTAPEQLADAGVDARTDVYSLGCVFYEALTGEVPYPRECAAAKLFAHFEAAPPSVIAALPSAPARLEDVVQRALAKDPDARYSTAGEFGRAALLAVTGLPDRPVCRPVPPRPRRAIPLPPALTSELAQGTFVGRVEALTSLTRRFELAATGRRQIALVSGEPGIGKTRLASESGRRAREEHATVLYGRSDSESLVPYQPFVGALQHYLAHVKIEAFPQHLWPELGELARFIPALRRDDLSSEPISGEPDMQRYRLFEAVTRVLAFIARKHPAVLILDDLQWADTSTALLLAHVLQSVEPVKLLVIGTVRPGTGWRSEQLAELVARLHSDASFERIALRGLDRAETQALVRSHGRPEAGDEFVRRLREGTDGNPLFIKETLRTLAQTVPAGTSGDELERELYRLAVPESVKQLIGRGLARLSATANRVLRVASVVGREFRLEVLETVIAEPADEILCALEEVAAAGLVHEVSGDPGHFVFSQALARETLYEQQSASRRLRLHHKVGEALEACTASPAALAHHFFESRHLDGAGKAIDYAVRAAEQAAVSLSYEEAAEHYERALAALARRRGRDDRRRCDLLLGRGGAQLRADDPAARETFRLAAELARSERLPEQFAHAALGFAGRYAHAGSAEPAEIALLEEALAALGERESPLVVLLLARLANSLHCEAEEVRIDALSARGLALARRTADPAALAAALESRHTALLYIEHLSERMRLGGELLALAQRIGERELEALGRHWRVFDLVEAGDIEAARREHRALAHLAKELRQPVYHRFDLLWEVLWAQMADRFEEADGLAARAFALGQRAHASEAHKQYGGQLVARAYRERRLPELVGTLESRIAENPQRTMWRALLALAQLQAGKRNAARAELEWLARDDFGAVPRDIMAFSTFCLCAEACAGLGDRVRARVLYAILLPHRARVVLVGVTACLGSAERFLGLLAVAMDDRVAAAEHFDAAIAANVAHGLDHIVDVVRRESAELTYQASADTP